MKRRLLDILVCPVCKGALDLHVLAEDGRDIQEGILRCGACRLAYPILKGIPRLIRNAFDEYFAWFREKRDAIGGIAALAEVAASVGRTDRKVFDKRSNESFSLQWSKYEYQDRTWYKDDTDLRSHEFLYSMQLEPHELRNRIVLDAGCGNGKLTACVARFGAEVIGMDLSRSVERAAENAARIAGKHAPFVHFVQGNILEPPFAPGTFDHIHSSGVLHHTPDTWASFDSFRALAKPGARVYVQLYRVRERWVRVPNRILRAVTTRLPVKATWRLCWRLVPVHSALVRAVGVMRGEKSPISKFSRRERAVSLFDHLSPRYQYRYTPDEVREKFLAANLLDVQDVTLRNEARHMVAFVGTKPPARGAGRVDGKKAA
jgi:uncharacterized protein YbaR (Trm112 family)/SAM-dependent methyltransferase